MLYEVITFSTVDRALDTTSIYGNYQIGLWDRLFLTLGVAIAGVRLGRKTYLVDSA